MANLSAMTYTDLEIQVRRQTGTENFTELPSGLIMRWTNILQYKIYLLARKSDGAWGRNTTTLTNLNATGKYNAKSGGGSYTAATKTFSGLTGLDQTYVGGWVFFVDGVNTRYFYGLIDTVTGTTSCTLRFQIGTGAAVDIASAQLTAFIKPAPAFYTGANLSGVSVHNVVKVVDSSLGNMVRLEEHQFPGAATHPSYKNVAYVQYAGDSVYIGKGQSAGAYGVWTLVFDEKPTVISAPTDTVDLRPEFLPSLVDEVSGWVMNYVATRAKAA
jgi:hypothetical protein